MTFCKESGCTKFSDCHRALTTEVLESAERWIKDAPIATFSQTPECFTAKQKIEPNAILVEALRI
jgi:hypothetical protein